MNRKKRSPKKPVRSEVKQCPGDMLPADWQCQKKRIEWVFLGLLLAMGIYLTVVYFGHQVVPNSDFPAFVKTGQQILNFQVPSSFKRVPVLGMLQVGMGKLMFTSPHPILTGGLVLNGILYTLSILLFYKICRFYSEPTASFCVALIAALNPWSLSMIVSPIAETAIVFFLLLTLYLIFKRSWWCYLAAMVASMTRYECFGLIGIALLFDLFSRKGKRQKLAGAGLALAASVPMILWLIGTKMTKVEAGGHYFRVFWDVEHRNGFNLLKMLWRTSFSSLLQWPEWIHAILIEKPTTRQAADAIQLHNAHFQEVWNIIATVFFVLGLVWTFLKKQWKLLGAVIFWAGYVFIHMSQNVLLDRYTVPVIWLTLLISTYGLILSGKWLAERFPKAAGYAFAGIAAMVAFVWTMRLCPAVSKTKVISPTSETIVYAGLLVTTIALAVKQVLFRRKCLFADICLLLVVALIIVSNQFMLSFQLGKGDQDIEFKMLAEWYREHAGRNEKLVTTMKPVVDIFIPEYQHLVVHTGSVKGENIAEFALDCKKRQLRYIAWDSRLGFFPKDYYYQHWGLKKIQPLGSGRDVGPFKFIQKIEANPRRYLNLYRLEFDELPTAIQ